MKWFTKVVQILDVATAINFKKTVVALQDGRTRGPTHLGQKCCHQAVSTGYACVQRFGNRTKIGLQSPRQRSGNSYGIACLIGGESRKPAGGRRRTKDTDHRSRMPAMVVMRKRYRAGDFTFHFQPDDVWGKGILSGEVLDFKHRLNSGGNGCIREARR